MKDFVLTHKFNSIKSLLNILKEEKISSGSKLDEEYRICLEVNLGNMFILVY